MSTGDNGRSVVFRCVLCMFGYTFLFCLWRRHCSAGPVKPTTIQYNTMQCNAMQCNAMQCNAMQCNAMQCNAMQCNAMQCNAMQCNAMQCNAMQCNAMQCNAMQCNAMQCNAMQCNAMQCNAIQKVVFSITPIIINMNNNVRNIQMLLKKGRTEVELVKAYPRIQLIYRICYTLHSIHCTQWNLY